MKTKRGILDGYKTYDTANGFGSADEWQKSFYKRMTGEEAQQIVRDNDQSPFAILEIAANSTLEQIKAAFRKLIMIWHPDKNPGNLALAEMMSKKIIAAYTILTHK